MAIFRLRWADQSVEVLGSCIVGRGEDCQILVDDPRASRRHAKVTADGETLWLDDLGSRNGIQVNGVKVTERQRLLGGDVIKIGAQEIRVIAPGMPELVQEIERPEPTRRFDAFGVVGQLAEKALGLGRPDEAERLLSGVFEQMHREAKAGVLPPREVLEKATVIVLKLLSGTGRGVWLDWLVDVYAAVRKPWPAEVVDELYEVGRLSNGHNRQGLRGYCELLRAIQGDLGPAERFQVNRIEGLERVLSAL